MIEKDRILTLEKEVISLSSHIRMKLINDDK